MAASIHPTAVVDPAATLGDGVAIGPLSVVGPNVELGDGVTLHSHVVVEGHSRIGDGTTIFPFASVGHIPQDLKFGGETSRLLVGKGCTIREHVTMSPGTKGGGMVTRVGDHCLFMVGAHVAHDCIIGNHVILVNNATLGGHVEIGDHAFLGGLCAVQQFVRIGEHSFIGGMTGVEQDVIPYGMVVGERGHLRGLNLRGLRRRGFERSDVNAMRSAYRTLFGGQGEMAERIEAVAAKFGESGPVGQLIGFLRDTSARSVLKPKLADAA